MSQMDLLRRLQELFPEDKEGALNRQHLNNSINRDLQPMWARRIEKGLELEEGTLDRWVNKDKSIK